MDAAPSLKPMPIGFRALTVGAVVHALVVLAFWAAEFIADLHVISARWWLALAWLWLIWPVVLAFHPARTWKSVAIALGVGIALLLPCVSTIYTFTVWAIEGFAP
jgi:hypothetical protein